MASKLHIVVASTRPGRRGPSVARWFEGFARQHGEFDPVLIDLADFNLPVYDEPKHPLTRQYEHEHTNAGARASTQPTPMLSSFRNTTISRRLRS